MLFCALRKRRFDLSTALLVAPSNRSSKNTSAFSRFGLFGLFKLLPNFLKRRTRRRNLSSFFKAVWVLQRRSNSRYTSSMISRSVRSGGSPRVSLCKRSLGAGLR